MLSPEQRSLLLQIARNSIERVLNGTRPEVRAEDLDADLRRPSGAFVSLHTKGRELRGCIGSIHAVQPLYHAVSTSAINAALRDPRFHPLQKSELPHIHIEVSVMSPIVSAVPDDIEVGRDGIVISRGRYAGLLLPQVATEYGWDRYTFLSQTCVKAGLSPDAWRDTDCKIEKFSAEVFGE
jgi:uncharacterized protein